MSFGKYWRLDLLVKVFFSLSLLNNRLMSILNNLKTAFSLTEFFLNLYKDYLSVISNSDKSEFFSQILFWLFWKIIILILIHSNFLTAKNLLLYRLEQPLLLLKTQLLILDLLTKDVQLGLILLPLGHY